MLLFFGSGLGGFEYGDISSKKKIQRLCFGEKFTKQKIVCKRLSERELLLIQNFILWEV